MGCRYFTDYHLVVGLLVIYLSVTNMVSLYLMTSEVTSRPTKLQEVTIATYSLASLGTSHTDIRAKCVILMTR